MVLYCVGMLDCLEEVFEMRISWAFIGGYTVNARDFDHDTRSPHASLHCAAKRADLSAIYWMQVAESEYCPMRLLEEPLCYMAISFGHAPRKNLLKEKSCVTGK